VTGRAAEGGVDPSAGAPVELTAPAKLTLSLRVTGTRPDGYHLLESEMVTLDLADTLVVGPGHGLTIFDRMGPVGPGGDGDGPRPGPGGGGGSSPGQWRSTSLPAGPDNLVARALDAVGRSARVHLTKRIPPGAGLGGGSADAAAILRWAGCSDLALAAGLGADVPFCLTGGRAMVRGIGGELTPLPFEARRFTLLLAPFGVDTGAVYRAWDELAAAGDGERPGGRANDLEYAALVVEPRLAPWRQALGEAAGVEPRLAGSGSTWFVEGAPEELGLDVGPWLHLGAERALLVPARTTPPLG
jgi:4-diphosphocytidyl-2-C-methyl-D-erythritol kinase